MSYENFSAVDFAIDERFRHWIKSPTPEADAYWAAFLEQHPEKQTTIAEARLLVSRLKVNAETASPEQLEQLWRRIQQQTQAAPAQQPTKQTRVISFWHEYATPFRWAAVWGGILLLAGLTYWQFNQSREIRYETAYGETKRLTLPDGSIVTLNGHSILTHSDEWTNQTDRQVQLTGEAFFAVTKRKTSAGQPVKFRVLTTDLRIDVLGTRFNVSQRRNRTEIVLQEGKVQVSSDQVANEPTVMKPGEMVTYLSTNRRLTKATVNPLLFTSWQDKLLIFKERPVRDIVQILSDSYGIQVEFRNRDIADKRFSGSVPTDSVELFFTKIQKLYGVSVRQEKHHYIIE